MVDVPANAQLSTTLREFRKNPRYRFSVFDGGIAYDCNSADELMFQGRTALMESTALADKRLLLAMVENGHSAVMLYADRDYFEIVKRERMAQRHICSWQFAADWKGCGLDMLEYLMGKALQGDGIFQKLSHGADRSNGRVKKREEMVPRSSSKKQC